MQQISDLHENFLRIFPKASNIYTDKCKTKGLKMNVINDTVCIFIYEIV